MIYTMLQIDWCTIGHRIKVRVDFQKQGILVSWSPRLEDRPFTYRAITTALESFRKRIKLAQCWPNITQEGKKLLGIVLFIPLKPLRIPEKFRDLTNRGEHHLGD